MKKLRIGMVGAGNIANVHLEAYKAVENVEIVAICDINPETLAETAKKFGIDFIQGIVNGRPLHTRDFMGKLVLGKNIAK